MEVITTFTLPRKDSDERLIGRPVSPQLLSHIAKKLSIDRSVEEFSTVERDIQNNVRSCEKSSELDTYVLAFIDTFRSIISSSSDAEKESFQILSSQVLDEGATVIRDHAIQNIIYCSQLIPLLDRKKLVPYNIDLSEVSSTSFASAVSDFVHEYLKLSPGLWNENVFLNHLLHKFLPFILSTSLKCGTEENYDVIPDAAVIAESPHNSYEGALMVLNILLSYLLTSATNMSCADHFSWCHVYLPRHTRASN